LNVIYADYIVWDGGSGGLVDDFNGGWDPLMEGANIFGCGCNQIAQCNVQEECGTVVWM